MLYGLGDFFLEMYHQSYIQFGIQYKNYFNYQINGYKFQKLDIDLFDEFLR